MTKSVAYTEYTRTNVKLTEIESIKIFCAKPMFSLKHCTHAMHTKTTCGHDFNSDSDAENDELGAGVYSNHI